MLRYIIDILHYFQVKKLQEMRGNDLCMVTKCIMDTLITDNFGKQMSLTGRGSNNKKDDKIALKCTTLYKLVMSKYIIKTFYQYYCISKYLINYYYWV